MHYQLLLCFKSKLELEQSYDFSYRYSNISKVIYKIEIKSTNKKRDKKTP